MNSLSYRTAGRFTIAAGILWVIASFLLFGFFGGSGLMGTMNDVIGVVSNLLTIPLFLALGEITKRRNARLGLTVQLVGVLALLLRMASGVLILSGVPFESAAVWEYMGATLVGSLMITVAIANRRDPLFGRGYVIFSAIIGFAVALNILSFIAPAVTDQLLQAMLGSGELNPLLYPLLLMAPVYIIGFPIWVLWSGRLLLRAAAQEDEALQPNPG